MRVVLVIDNCEKWLAHFYCFLTSKILDTWKMRVTGHSTFFLKTRKLYTAYCTVDKENIEWSPVYVPSPTACELQAFNIKPYTKQKVVTHPFQVSFFQFHLWHLRQMGTHENSIISGEKSDIYMSLLIGLICHLIFESIKVLKCLESLPNFSN